MHSNDLAVLLYVAHYIYTVRVDIKVYDNVAVTATKEADIDWFYPAIVTFSEDGTR